MYYTAASLKVELDKIKDLEFDGWEKLEATNIHNSQVIRVYAIRGAKLLLPLNFYFKNGIRAINSNDTSFRKLSSLCGIDTARLQNT